MKDTENLEGTSSQMPVSSSVEDISRFARYLELIALGELYFFSVLLITGLVLIPIYMAVYIGVDLLYIIGGPVVAALFWFLPFQEFKDRFSDALHGEQIINTFET
jgi:hypothetical protein